MAPEEGCPLSPPLCVTGGVLSRHITANGERVGEQVIRQMAREGRLPAHRPGGQRAYVFYVDEVVAWLKAQGGQVHVAVAGWLV